jgi:RNA-splicing ligase RtcB
MELETKYGQVKIFAETIDEITLSQVMTTANSPLGEGAHIRIMPDCHAGAGCVIGTTMKITDKVCPNLVGVDIACSVRLVKTDVDFRGQFEKLDKCIRNNVPSGRGVYNKPSLETEWFEQLRCYDKLKRETIRKATLSVGTLGGGNHFIEAYDDGYLSVHTGSRNIGLNIAKYYQDLAVRRHQDEMKDVYRQAIESIPEQEREAWIKENRTNLRADLAYLTGEDKDDYLHDIGVIQQFAKMNREKIIEIILVGMRGRQLDYIDSQHNFIDIERGILRKGATDASKGRKLLIPMNMRDGMLICEGKGNEDWNCSAPHGAGRLYARNEAKKTFTVNQYKKSMDGIYSTCINQDTLDEAPFVYKAMDEIIRCIEPTATVLERLRPIYNFKAGKE